MPFSYLWHRFITEPAAKLQKFCNKTKLISEKMELFQKLLSKDEINNRFIMAVNAVIRHNLVPNKSALAESLGVKQAKFSEILNGRMKAGTDMLAIMCDFYKVSAEWLLMSRGNNIFRENPNLPKYWVDDDDLTSIYPSESQKPQKTSSISGAEPFLALIREKDDVIRSQAEEIGRLKERVEQLEREKNDYALSSQTIPKELEISPTD